MYDYYVYTHYDIHPLRVTASSLRDAIAQGTALRPPVVRRGQEVVTAELAGGDLLGRDTYDPLPEPYAARCRR